MRISDWSSDVCSSDLSHNKKRAKKNGRPKAPVGCCCNTTDYWLVLLMELMSVKVPTVLLRFRLVTFMPENSPVTTKRHLPAPSPSAPAMPLPVLPLDRKSTRLNSSH